MAEKLTDILIKCLSPDNNLRQAAEVQLKRAREQNLAVYLATLVVILNDETKPKEARQMSGMVLKNELQGKSEQRNKQLAQQWRSLDPNIQGKIRVKVLETLHSNNYPVRKVSARVLASIASIDLYERKWVDVINILSKNVTEPKTMPGVESSLMALGYLCEICRAQVIDQNSNIVLTAVFHGMRNKTNTVIKLAGVDAFFNCLELAESNFQKVEHRNFIFRCLLECAVSPDPRVRKSALECIVKIAFRYYPVIGFYLNDLTKVTVQIISRDQADKVVMQAIEFWSTLAEVEFDIVEELDESKEMNRQAKRKYHQFIKAKLQILCPVLTKSLLKQSEESDQWNVSTAAGTCMSLISKVVGDEVVQIMMPFIMSNINNQDWHYREAATLAFSAILDGPKSEKMQNLVWEAIPHLLNHVKDPHELVQDTTIFCLGRIAQYQPAPLINKYLEPVLKALMFATTLKPVIAEKACWAVLNIAKDFEPKSAEVQTSPLSRYFQGLCEKVLQVTARPDLAQANLRLCSYEALSMLISVCTPDCYAYLDRRVVNALIQRLIGSIQSINPGNRVHLEIVQGLLCGSLAHCTEKLGPRMKPYSDNLMRAYLTILQSNNAPVQQEVFTAIGVLATSLQDGFSRYMNTLFPYLLKGLRSQREEEVCIASIYCIVDITYAIKKRMSQYADDIIRTLLVNLRSNEISRDIKPLIISSFGDISFGIGGEFRKYVLHIAAVLKNAGNAEVNRNEEEMVEYLNNLRENIFDAYSGILQGVKKDDPTIFDPFVKNLIEFINTVYRDRSTDQEVIIKACTCLGDLVNVYGSKCKEYINFPFIRNLIHECSQSRDQDTLNAAEYTRTQIRAKFGNM